MAKRIELPQIVRQVDVGVLLTSEGNRISVKEYEALRVKYGEQENAPKPATKETWPVVVNETVVEKKADGIEPEVHPSQNVPGEAHGQLVPNPSLVQGGFVDHDDVNRDGGEVGGDDIITDENGEPVKVGQESTPAIDVVKTGEANHEVEPSENEGAVEVEELPVAIDHRSPATDTSGKTHAEVENGGKEDSKEDAPVAPAKEDNGEVVDPQDEPAKPVKPAKPTANAKK